MPFNTLSYLIFLPVVFLVHYFSPDRFRWLVLLVASFVFYSALKTPHLLSALSFVIIITYYTGIFIDRNESPRAKQYLLWGGIVANVLVLVILKYLPFLAQNLDAVLTVVAPGASIPVNKAITTIGVSYFIFQAISYLVDIYLGIERSEKHFGRFALYMSFFPKLLQGPIERCGDLLPQFRERYSFDNEKFRLGMILLAWGMFKKVVIADRLAFIVNPVFDKVHDYSGIPLLVVSYCYSMQIYFDFSGYSDMALGAAYLFNIKLTQNFNSPYMATSIADFWRRWHISFSRWILDYIFKPLQITWRSKGSFGTVMALLITFTISGFWHGATWGYVVWGLLHGVSIAIGVVTSPYKNKLVKWLGLNNLLLFNIWNCFVTFNLVSIAWVFFRANSINDAIYFISSVINVDHSKRSTLSDMLNTMYQGRYTVMILFCLAIMTAIISALKHKNYHLESFGTISRWLIYFGMGYLIVVFGVVSVDPSFMYFRY